MRSAPKRFLAFTLFSLFGQGVSLCAQSVSAALTITAIEGPKNGGFALGIQGIHRVEPNTGKCIATIALKPRKGILSLAYGDRSLF